MKKIIAILLAMALCRGAALAEEADITGEWFATEITMGELSFNPVNMGVEMSITLNADGTTVVQAAGEKLDGTWVKENGSAAVTTDGKTMIFTPVDGKLVTEDSGAYLIFEREKPEAERYVPAEPMTDATMEDYNGVWDAVLADVMGMQTSVAAMGMSMQFVVSDGQVMVVEGVGEEATYGETTGIVENGTLKIQSEGNELSLQLCQDGVLVLVQDMGEGMTVSIYFEKLIADIEE